MSYVFIGQKMAQVHSEKKYKRGCSKLLAEEYDHKGWFSEFHMSNPFGLQNQIPHENLHYCLANPSDGKWRKTGNQFNKQSSKWVATKSFWWPQLGKQHEHMQESSGSLHHCFLCFKTRRPKYGVLKKVRPPPHPCDVHIASFWCLFDIQIWQT